METGSRPEVRTRCQNLQVSPVNPKPWDVGGGVDVVFQDLVNDGHPE